MTDLTDFEVSMNSQHLAEGTISNYLRELQKLPSEKHAQQKYLSENSNNNMLIRAYRKYLRFQRKQRLISAEELLDQLDTYTLPKRRGSTQNHNWLPLDQWGDLVANAPSRCAKMGIWLGLQFGLRKGEIRNLRVQDIDLTNNKVLIQIHKENKSKKQDYWHPKHRKERFIPITTDQHEILARWIEERPVLNHPYLIFTAQNKPVQGRTFNRWLEKASNKELAPHDLRRSFAKVLYNESKKNIKLVQLTLGHSNIAITSTYLGLDTDEIHDEFTKAMG